MIRPVHTPNFVPQPLIENEKKGKSSLAGRIQLNWDTAILVCNTALILAGAAFTFFIKLPLISLSLLGYGIVYLVADGFARKAQPKGSELQKLEAKLKQKDETIAEKENQFKKLLEDKDVRPELRREIEDLRETIRVEKENLADQEKIAQANIDRLSRKIAQLRGERDGLRQTVRVIED